MTETNHVCSICGKISLWRAGRNPHFIHEFRHSIFVVGDHQFFQGYSLLLLKDHVRELHEMPAAAQPELFQELMIATRAVAETFRPWKINHACYGNAAPHVHWHIFPRYESDPDHRNHPWLHSAEFDRYLIDPRTAQAIATKISEAVDLF